MDDIGGLYGADTQSTGVTKARKRRGRVSDETQLSNAAPLIVTKKRAKKISGLSKADAPSHGATNDGGAAFLGLKSDTGMSPAIPNSDGLTMVDTHMTVAVSAESSDLSPAEPQRRDVALSATIDAIREMHRRRNDFHRAEKSLTLQIKSICRRFALGDKTQADVIYKDMPIHILAYVEGFLIAREMIETRRKQAEKQVQKLAKTMPAYDWVENCRGLSSLSFGQIIGECGDLSNYSNPGKLWKRMGLAVFNGKSQRKTTNVEDAILQGYSPHRRSLMFVIGDNLIRASNPRYRPIYDERKAMEIARDPEIRPIVAHRRAKRYIEKRLLKELWQAWRGHEPPDDLEPLAPPVN